MMANFQRTCRVRGVVLALAAGLAVAVWTATGSSASAFPSMTGQGVDAYPAAELLDAVKDEIRTEQMQLPEDATSILREFVAKGAEDYEPARRAEALENARTVGRGLAKEAKQRNSRVVTSEIAKSVIAGVCPLFPFCK